MDTPRLLEGLASDVARLRAVAARSLTASVPTCPGWTVDDLVRHVADLYVNVVVRRLRMPEDTPKQDLAGEESLAALDRCYTAMTEEFAARDPQEHVGQQPSETGHFWIRRMAHETAIHRVDAELAVGDAVTPIPPDLAIDGIEEMLTVFLGEATHLFPEDFAADLHDWADRWVLVSAGDTGWRVTSRPDGVDVERADTQTSGATSVRGEPGTLLRWLYNRADDGAVVSDGDGELVAQLRRLLTAVTNTN